MDKEEGRRGEEEIVRKEGVGDGKEGGRYNIVFWNVAGLRNKGKDFWEEVKKWDVIIMSEVWLEEKGWRKIKEVLPRGYKWEIQLATRKNRKGRAMGGMLIGIKVEINTEEVVVNGIEGVVEMVIELGKEKWKVMGVYVKEDLDKKLEKMREWAEEKREGVRMLIGGDFNARTGMEGGMASLGEWRVEEKGRRSMDRKINAEGRKMIKWVEEMGWTIFNGGIEGDEEGYWTYTGGRGESVIDYVLGDGETREQVERIEVGENIDSDHHPMVVSVRVRGKEKAKKGGKGGKIKKWTWSMEGREEFREEMGKIEESIGEVGEVWQEMKEKVRKIFKKGCKVKEVVRREGWWDEECKEEKKRVRKELRRWRRGEGSRHSYREAKERYNRLLGRKEEERKKWEKEIREIKTEGQVWEVVRRERKKRKRINEGIRMEEWDKFFRELLGGVDGKVVRGKERGMRGDEEEEIGREEIKKVIKELKANKAAGGMKFRWKYGSMVGREWRSGYGTYVTGYGEGRDG